MTGETGAVSDVLEVPIARGCDLYLAWNISVASGTAAQSAMAIGIDDFAVSGELPKIPASKHYVFVDDQTGWDALGLYAWGDSELFGAWPGEATVGDSIVAGKSYKVFLLDTEGGNYHLIFNNWNNGQQLPDYDITATRDFFFKLTSTTVTEVTPAVAGDVNGDGEVTGSDVTALYNHILFGQDTEIFNGDQNGDGEVTGSDVTAVYNIILGL